MELLNVDQAADFLGVHRGTVYAWVESGRLPCLRAGSRLRFLREDLLSWARRNGGASDTFEDTPGVAEVGSGEDHRESRG